MLQLERALLLTTQLLCALQHQHRLSRLPPTRFRPRRLPPLQLRLAPLQLRLPPLLLRRLPLMQFRRLRPPPQHQARSKRNHEPVGSHVNCHLNLKRDAAKMEQQSEQHFDAEPQVPSPTTQFDGSTWNGMDLQAAAAAQDAARTELAQIDALVLALDARRQVLRLRLIGATPAAPTSSGVSGTAAPTVVTVASTVAAGPTAAQAAAASIAAQHATVPARA